ncbi:MAG: PHP domain-containing protein, partial [Oscillospiraceae bacterium]|nr:PHP domain-containing protein [Oscillospiraceae bacterium]
MTQTLRDFLREYAAKLPENVLAGRIRRVMSNADRSKLYFETEFDAPIPFSVLSEFESELADRLNIQAVRLLCRYPAETFSTDVLADLFVSLRRDLPMMNGFLDDAGLVLDRERHHLTITLRHGGVDILESTRFREELARAVRTIYSVGLEISFDGGLQHVTPEAHDTMQEEVLATMPPPVMPAPKEKEAEAAPVFSSLHSAPDDAAPIQPVMPSKEDLSVIYGRKIKEKPVAISEVVKNLNTAGRVCIACEVFGDVDTRTLKNGKTLLTFPVTDYTGSLLVKMFLDEEKLADFPVKECKKGANLLIFGSASFDEYDHDIIIKPTGISTYTPPKRTDDAPVKRVELHLHTNMSAMDGINAAKDLINRAHEWGHRAIAITDHGVVQAFPEAMNATAKMKDFRVIYGCEAYVVNDLDLAKVIDTPDPRSVQDEVIVFDVETTGLSPNNDRLTEIGAVKVRGLKIIDSFQTFVNPGRKIPDKIVELTGITDDMVANAPSEQKAVEDFMAFCGENPVLIAHNAAFDTAFLRNSFQRCGMQHSFATLDTVVLCRAMLPELSKHKLNIVAKHLKLGKFDHHRANDDACMLAKIYITLMERLVKNSNLQTLAELNYKLPTIDPRKLKSYHQIILAKNQTGMKNLYRLVSYSQLDYFYKKPLIPKSVLLQRREGLLFGSACEAGELFA